MLKKSLNKFLIVCFILIFASSCFESTNKTTSSLEGRIDNILGKSLTISSSLNLYKPFATYLADSTEIVNSNYKIYSYINTSCGSCIASVDLWNKFSLRIKKYKIPVVLVCGSNDNFEMFKYFCETAEIADFPYPFLLDSKGEYIKLNEFMAINSNFKTVLVNKDNSIVLLGDPTQSKEMEVLYLNEIKKIMNDI